MKMPSWSTSLKVDWENEEMKDEKKGLLLRWSPDNVHIFSHLTEEEEEGSKQLSTIPFMTKFRVIQKVE